MSDYLNPPNTEEFFDFLFDLGETRFDTSTSLYCKCAEWCKDSFLYQPACALVVNEETEQVVINKLKELKLTGDITKETFEDCDTYNLSIVNIKQTGEQDAN